MATPFSEVFDVFLRKISDYSFINLTSDEMDQLLSDYLISAIPKFNKCKTDLSARDSAQFQNTLTDEEKEILGTIMIDEWLRPQIFSIELLKQSLGSKDWQLYSQANHLKELRELRKDVQNEIDSMLISYSYSNGNMDDLK